MRLHGGKCFIEYKEFHPHWWLLLPAKDAYRRGSTGARTSCEEKLKNLRGSCIRKSKLYERYKEISDKTLALITQTCPLGVLEVLDKVVETVST